MLHLLGKIPRKVVVATSGGPDSMAVLDFLKNNHDIIALHIHHGTDHADHAMNTVACYCEVHSIPLDVRRIGRLMESKESEEAYWSEERGAIYASQPFPVVTGHHLDDFIEWAIISLARTGEPRDMPYKSHNNVIRPFLKNKKSSLFSWCLTNKVPYFMDPSNFDDSNMRAKIRKKVFPGLEDAHPGLYSVFKRRVESLYENRSFN